MKGLLSTPLPCDGSTRDGKGSLDEISLNSCLASALHWRQVFAALACVPFKRPVAIWQTAQSGTAYNGRSAQHAEK
jgi:hypothetical protein